MYVVALAEAFGDLEANTDSLDDCGTRFYVSLRIFACLQKALKPSLRPVSLPTSDFVWAFHSEAQDTLLQYVSSIPPPNSPPPSPSPPPPPSSPPPSPSPPTTTTTAATPTTTTTNAQADTAGLRFVLSSHKTHFLEAWHPSRCVSLNSVCRRAVQRHSPAYLRTPVLFSPCLQVRYGVHGTRGWL